MSSDAPASVRLAFVGDVALAGQFLTAAQPAGAPLTYPFEQLAPLLQGTDILVLNLEGPLSPEGTPRQSVTTHLHNETSLLDWCRQFPACFCNLANNHMLDYGLEALSRTQRALAAKGMRYGGAGRNEPQASAPVRLEHHGQSISLLGYTTDAPHVGSVLAGPDTPGCASLKDSAAVLSSVARAAEFTDTVIVSLHWGHEYYHYPTPDQIRFAHQVVDAGATLVIGHHPHVQQGIEEYHRGLIAYSLGNLLLPELRSANGRVQYRKPITKQFAILRVEIAGRTIRRWEIEGGRCSARYQLLPYSGAARERFKAFMGELSTPLRSLDYPEFWVRAQHRRAVQLRRESLRDALAKLWLSDWRTLVQTISWHDFKRNVGRIVGAVASRPRSET